VRIKFRRAAQDLATTAFLLMFPGFLIYHYLVGSLGMPPFLGGLFGNVAAVTVAGGLLLAAWLARREVWGGLPAAILFFTAWIYFAAWTTVGAISVSGEPYGAYAAREPITMLVFWLAMFFVGSFYGLDAKRHRVPLIILSIGIGAVLLHAIIVHESLLGPYVAFSPRRDAEVESSTYQGAGRSLVVTGIVVSALARQHWKQLAILATAVLASVALGSRTYMVGGACWLLVMLMISSVKGRRYGAVALIVVMVVAVGYVARTAFLEMRASEILDLSSSTSWRTRMGLQAAAMAVVEASPLLGDFAYHIREFGPGGYAHNAFSAWAEFGLIGFLLYCGLLLFFLGVCVTRVIFRRSLEPAWHVALGMNITAMLVVAAEPVFSMVPALAWGFAVNALMRERAAASIAIRASKAAPAPVGTPSPT
jgi:hypothetical protein